MIGFTKKGYRHGAYASRALCNIRVNLSAAVSARLLLGRDVRGGGELGSETVDDEAYQAVGTHVVGNFPEGVPGYPYRAPGTGDPGDNLHALTGGKNPAGDHGVSRAERHILRKMTLQALDGQGGTGLRGVAHEYKQWGTTNRGREGRGQRDVYMNQGGAGPGVS